METTLKKQGEGLEYIEPSLSAALYAGAGMASKYIQKALYGDFALLWAGK